MPPPQAIVCSTCGGKFFEQSYPIHVKKCKEKFAASHTECDQCGLKVNNNDWAMHKQSCKISPRAKKRMQELKARAAKHLKNATAQQQARNNPSAAPAAAPDTAETKIEARAVAAPAPAPQPTEVPEHCQECSEAACDRYCGECEQFLCSSCSESLHKKGARARHTVNPLVASSSGAEENSEVRKAEGPTDDAKGQKPVAALYANAFDAEADKGDLDREPCRICGRKFANDRLYIHERVCANLETKKKSKKRKVYKGTELRTRGTEFAQFLKKKPETPREIEEWHEQGGRRWRQEADEFRQIIETNKAMDEMKAAGLLPPDPPKAKLRDTVGMSGLGGGRSESKAGGGGGGGGGSGASMMKSKGGATFEIDMSEAAIAAAAAHQAKPTARAAATTRKPKEPAKPDISGAVPLPKPAKAAEPAKKEEVKAAPKPAPSPTPAPAPAAPSPAPSKPISAGKPSAEPANRPPSVVKQAAPAPAPAPVSKPSALALAPAPTPVTTSAPAPVAGAPHESKGSDHNAPRNLQKEKMERARARARVAEEKRRDEQAELPPPPPTKVTVRSEFTDRLIARERGDEALEQLRAAKGQKRASSRTGGLRTENVRTVQGRISAGSPAPAKRNSANSGGRRSASVGRAPSGGSNGVPRSNSNQNNRATESPVRQAALTRSVSDLHKASVTAALPAINRSSSSAALAGPSSSATPVPTPAPVGSAPHAVAPIVKSSSAVKLPQIPTSSSSHSLAQPPAPSHAPIAHHQPSPSPHEIPSSSSSLSTVHSQPPVPLPGKPAASMTEYLERERLRRMSAGRERLNKISAAPIPAPSSSSPPPVPTSLAPAPVEKRASAPVVAVPSSPVPAPVRAESQSSLEPTMSSEARAGSTAFDIPLKAEGQTAKSKPKLSSDAPKKKVDLVSTNPTIGQAPTRLHATVIDGKVQRILEHPTIPSKPAAPIAQASVPSESTDTSAATVSESDSRPSQKDVVTGAQSQVRNARSSFLERVVSQHKLTEESAGASSEAPRS